MDLDGEVVAGVQHLDEDGETRMVYVSGAEHFLALVRPEFMEGCSGKRPFIDDGLFALAVHDFPRFAKGAGGIGQAAVIDAFELASAPDAFHIERLEGDQVHVWKWVFKSSLTMKSTRVFLASHVRVAAKRQCCLIFSNQGWMIDVGLSTYMGVGLAGVYQEIVSGWRLLKQPLDLS